MLAAAAGAGLDHRVDPELVRAHEVMEVRGDPGKLRAATGWEPRSRWSARSPTPSPGGASGCARPSGVP